MPKRIIIYALFSCFFREIKHNRKPKLAAENCETKLIEAEKTKKLRENSRKSMKMY